MQFLVRICKSFLPLAAETMGVVIKLLVVQVVCAVDESVLETLKEKIKFVVF